MEPTPSEAPRRRGRPRLAHCKNGHERTDANVYTSPSGHRACRLCLKDNAAAFAARHRASRLAAESAYWNAQLDARNLEPTAEDLEGDARQRETEARWAAEGRFDC